MSETFVLIAGAWHGGWAWRPVAQALRAAGHRVHTPTMPGLHDGDDPTRLTFGDVVDSVVDMVERADLADVTLVGHSWGGYVITAATPRLRRRLKKVIYWSAFVPAEGRSLLDEIPPSYQELFAKLARESGDNTVPMPLEAWQAAFMQDAPGDVSRAIHALLVPQPFQFINQLVNPVDFASLGIPASYVLTTEDITLSAEDWARFTSRLGVEPVLAPGSHEACFTRPNDLADAFLRA